MQPSQPVEKPQNANASETEQSVLDFTNAERVKAGLKPLQIDAALQKSVKQKSANMATNNYFSHTSPTYGFPFEQMRANGVTYRSAGGNIAKGYPHVQAVGARWMDSAGY
ncbi:CAP domain-containing protein [Sporosarcina sp. GW1-11]|uniref:CAP domain-containing protein n=1 Tax=Sporosarcina sp. GW1-11 TaxID=2899126 RepID=UPI00294C131E|nr:CAP domain-containing protein [Sporosarcina sp. GW1-11]MDV6378874.1 CAP domain-containing protein [Sporosarcina sp. GW1-11]